MERHLLHCNAAVGSFFIHGRNGLFRDIRRCFGLVFCERFRCPREGSLPRLFILEWRPVYLPEERAWHLEQAEEMLVRLMLTITTLAHEVVVGRANLRKVTACLPTRPRAQLIIEELDGDEVIDRVTL